MMEKKIVMSEEEKLDDEGNPAPFKKGDRVIFLPHKKEATVIRQILHYDMWESFWGNLIIQCDDGQMIECNCWQTKKIDDGDRDEHEN